MSTIIADNLTGKTSAGSITVTSEGGAATQSLQQGLAKAWVNFDGTLATSASDLTGVRDSFNISALVDNGSGDYTVEINNDMSNDDYAVSNSASSSITSTDTMVNPYTWATGSVALGVNSANGTLTNRTTVNCTIHGDLA